MRLFLMCGYFCLGFFSSDVQAVDVKSKIKLTSSWTTKDTLECRFEVQPESGLKVNKDGPWLLKIGNHEGLKVKNEKLDKSQIDWSMPGFSVIADWIKPEQKAGNVEYTLEAYLCSQDGQLCFRDVHKGNLAWQHK